MEEKNNYKQERKNIRSWNDDEGEEEGEEERGEEGGGGRKGGRPQREREVRHQKGRPTGRAASITPTKEWINLVWKGAEPSYFFPLCPSSLPSVSLSFFFLLFLIYFLHFLPLSFFLLVLFPLTFPSLFIFFVFSSYPLFFTFLHSFPLFWSNTFFILLFLIFLHHCPLPPPNLLLLPFFPVFNSFYLIIIFVSGRLRVRQAPLFPIFILTFISTLAFSLVLCPPSSLSPQRQRKPQSIC